MTFFEVVARQRACREFSAEPVSDADVGRLLEAAMYAPSAENRQPWEFIVVRDRDLIASLAELARRAWDEMGRAFSVERLDAKLFADVERGATGGFATAPVHIVIAADTQRGLEQTVPSSTFPAVQNLLLAATALGLGSALTTIALGYRAELTSLLALPDTVVPVAIVPIGRPARPLGPPRRDPFAQHTHRDRYGNPW